MVLTLIKYSKNVISHRYLIWQLVKREFATRYTGSFLGLFWSFISPLFILAIYTFVFKFVFQARWGESENASNFQFALILFAGLVIHSLFTECVLRAPSLILNHASYVKRVIFPLEVLPLVLVINSFLHASASFFVLMIFYIIMNHSLPLSLIFVPFIIIPYLIFNVGLVLFLSAIGVYIRDFTQLMSLIVTISLFLTPIFYPISAVPKAFQSLVYCNPLTFVVEQLRDYTLFDIGPNWIGIGIYTGFSLLIFYLCLSFFQKTRKGFADVL